MSSTPKLAIVEMSWAQASKELTFNEAMRKLDALVNPVAISATLTGPPASPNDGDLYLTPLSGATGAWVGHEKKIAYYKSSAWVYITPWNGWTVRVLDEYRLLQWYEDGELWDAETGEDEYACSAEGVLADSQVLMRRTLTKNVFLPINGGLSKASCVVDAAAQTDIAINFAGTTGTIRFAAGAAVGTFILASGAVGAVGERVIITAPASHDTDLSGVSITLVVKTMGSL